MFPAEHLAQWKHYPPEDQQVGLYVQELQASQEGLLFQGRLKCQESDNGIDLTN